MFGRNAEMRGAISNYGDSKDGKNEDGNSFIADGITGSGRPPWGKEAFSTDATMLGSGIPTGCGERHLIDKRKNTVSVFLCRIRDIM